ncbi:hypothetical protein RRG08_011633 [Elysia crispata]|uniref:Uncharacterized protein n=1 Tax=Elysia crispata TaxID=231223 RepID=A0AAE0YWY7_9GAST|nr:hypothetical protein RRG08_011633 [Elysia crispata]
MTLKSYGSNTDNADNEVRHNKNGFTRLKRLAREYLWTDSLLATNYGLALSSLLLMGLFAPLVISSLMQYLGWHWLFQSSSIPLCRYFVICSVC